MRHPRVADFAVSFPALLFALAVPRPGLDPTCAIARAIAGVSLPDVAAAAGVPLWLRRLPPEAFACPIATLPDGEVFRRHIANHLPSSPNLAPTWLQAVANIVELAHDAAAVWIAREIARESRGEDLNRLRLIGLWAWFSGQPDTLGFTMIRTPWTPSMRIGPAVDAARDWQATVRVHVRLGRQRIADVWLQPARVGGYDFVPLTSASDLAEEAAAMKNCVRSYCYCLAQNRVRLWSVRNDGQRVATLSVAGRNRDPLPNIDELKAAGNAEAPLDVWWAVRQWLNMHDLSQVDMTRRERRVLPLDRVTWTSLWRPYWLAKHHIPEWLPLAPSRAALLALW